MFIELFWGCQASSQALLIRAHTNPEGQENHEPHLTDEETEAQRGYMKGSGALILS